MVCVGVGCGRVFKGWGGPDSGGWESPVSDSSVDEGGQRRMTTLNNADQATNLYNHGKLKAEKHCIYIFVYISGI